MSFQAILGIKPLERPALNPFLGYLIYFIIAGPLIFYLWPFLFYSLAQVINLSSLIQGDYLTLFITLTYFYWPVVAALILQSASYSPTCCEPRLRVIKNRIIAKPAIFWLCLLVLLLAPALLGAVFVFVFSNGDSGGTFEGQTTLDLEPYLSLPAGLTVLMVAMILGFYYFFSFVAFWRGRLTSRFILAAQRHIWRLDLQLINFNER